MTPHLPLTSGPDTAAATLRRLAGRAYRVLRQGRAEDRDEVRALIAEIARLRLLLDPESGDELASWLDRLEDQVSGLIDPHGCDTDHDHDHRAEPSACGGVGVA